MPESACGGCKPSVGPIEYYDWFADWFYRETGYIAPGIDVPAAMAHSNYENDRVRVWLNWRQTAYARIIKATEACGEFAAKEGKDEG